jgi:hypothetical protein
MAGRCSYRRRETHAVPIDHPPHYRGIRKKEPGDWLQDAEALLWQPQVIDDSVTKSCVALTVPRFQIGSRRNEAPDFFTISFTGRLHKGRDTRDRVGCTLRTVIVIIIFPRLL